MDQNQQGQHLNQNYDDNNNGDEESFFNQAKSQESQNNQAQNQNIVSKSQAFKQKKSKHIKKRHREHKKPKTSKQQERQKKKLQQAQAQADKIIDQMQKRYKEDLTLYEKKKPANKKLTYLDILSQKLKNLYVCEKFLQMNGLDQFQIWMSRLPLGFQPSLTLRKGLLQILATLRVRSEHVTKATQLQRILQKNKKSQTKQLRDLSESILLKWNKMQYDQQNQ